MYLGVDVGSITTKAVAIDETDQILAKVYLRNMGRPLEAIKEGLRQIRDQLGNNLKVQGLGTTGSARHLAAYLLGADVVKNEITAHAVAVIDLLPEVKTIIEIGGQDSKIIILQEGVVVDFAMNTVCAAGTGSFLDQQATRLGISVEEFGQMALRATKKARIAGRCTVFAETDMIHKQQMGFQTEEIVAGLCNSLVKNYLNDVGRGKDLFPPLVFQGGVAANPGIRKAFEEELGHPLVVPPQFEVMGALGAAKLTRRAGVSPTKFKGFEIAHSECFTRSIECDGCGNNCEVVELIVEGRAIACWGDRCGKFSEAFSTKRGSSPI
ncbi:MAG: 2-hydroxyglutaryl-CoA dehydratase [Deltaproteobacteria bacterium]|nr:2-hydroxyglutaryl-CoA dehydratase [Deltaproteobacteria bacterium]